MSDSQAQASILYSLFLQARHTCAGNTTMLSKVQTMQQMLVAKNTNIYHADVPAALVPKEKYNKKKCSGEDCPGGDWELGGGDEKHTHFLSCNPNNNIHPNIKTSFVNNLLKQVPNVTLSNMCKYCNTTVMTLFPDDK
eukprot:14980168-Ditylum_brightwellii.AAC.1